MKFILKPISPKLISLVVCAAMSQFSYGHEKETKKPNAVEEMIITGIRMVKQKCLFKA